jgi:metal-dependent amidase/aminoacylase/carboxypeptidase family protein
MDVKHRKEELCATVDAMRDQLLGVAQAIHAKPELAFQEHEAAALLVGLLREAGLEVSQGVYGLETAFAAEFGPEQGPCVALLAEYDALPEIGHACGHNLIATSAVGAGLAVFAAAVAAALIPALAIALGGGRRMPSTLVTTLVALLGIAVYLYAALEIAEAVRR